MEYLLNADKPVVLCTMCPDSKCVVSLNSLQKYCGAQKRGRYDGKIIATMGDRTHNGSGPPFAVIRDIRFKWINVNL